MVEKVSRRGVFKSLLVDGADAFSRLLSDAATSGLNETTDNRNLTPEEAGLLLHSRKNNKKALHLNTAYPEETICELKKNLKMSVY